jgi:hypothetical protein
VRKLKTRTLFIISLLFLGNSFAADPPPPILTNSSLKAVGATTNVPAGSYLRLVNFKKNHEGWFHEVKLVDEDNRPIKKGTLKISQEYLNKELKNKITHNLDFIDELTQKTVTGYPDQQYIIVSSVNKGWKTYSVQFVDDEGGLVDHKGIPVSVPRTYKVSQRYLDSDRLKSQVVALSKIQKEATRKRTLKEDCLKTTAPKTSLRPKPRPKDLVKIAAPSGSSYKYLTDMRSSLRAGGLRSCMNKKEKIQRDFLKKHPYGKLSIEGRANRIRSEAELVLSGIKKSSGSKNTKNKSRYKNFVNGHYIDPIVTPAVISCLAYQETKGNLNPYAVNYTLCNTKMASTAHGLGQITRSTMNGLSGNPDGDMMPLDSPYSSKYKGKSVREIHSQMSGDVGMQFEILVRILSSNAKHTRWKNRSLSEAEILKRSIILYDRDSQSKYIKNVVDNCIPCFKKGGSGSSCYKTVK